MYRGILLVSCLFVVGAVADGDGSAQAPALSRGVTKDAPALSPEVPGVRPLPFFYDLYTFKGNDRSTTILAAFAVPAGGLDHEQSDGDVLYRFDVSLVLADTLRRAVSRTDDSVFVSVPGSLSGDHILHTYIEVEAPPSGTTVQRVIMTDATTPGIGQLYDDVFPIRDYSGDKLMLSDIALGRTGTSGGWRRGGVTLALLPTSQLPRGPFEVYYEVYNLPEGNEYSTEWFIEALDGDDPESRSVRTQFTGEAAPAADGTLGELRSVDASLDDGAYRLSVRVTDHGTGATVEGTRTFQVRRWRRGATMVSALPWTGPGT